MSDNDEHDCLNPPDEPPLTDAERVWADAVLRGGSAIWPGDEPAVGHGDRVRVIAATLGFEAYERLPAHPWVIKGTIDEHAFRWSHDNGRYHLVIDGKVAERDKYTPTANEPADALRFILNLIRIHLGAVAGDPRPLFGYGDQVTALAAELGFEATETIPEFPWIIEGTVDRHGFRWRERGGIWELTIDGEDAYQGLYTMAAAEEPASTLRDILNRVRTHLLRRTCNHSRAFVEGDAFCGERGTQLRPLGPVTC